MEIYGKILHPEDSKRKKMKCKKMEEPNREFNAP